MPFTKTFNHRIFKKKLKNFMQKGGSYGLLNTWLKVGKNEIYVRKWSADASSPHETNQVFIKFSGGRTLMFWIWQRSAFTKVHEDKDILKKYSKQARDLPIS